MMSILRGLSMPSSACLGEFTANKPSGIMPLPPSCACFSKRITLAPFWAAEMAAHKPEAPPPITTTSTSMVISGVGSGVTSPPSVAVAEASLPVSASASPVSACAPFGAHPASPKAARPPMAAAPVRKFLRVISMIPPLDSCPR